MTFEAFKARIKAANEFDWFKVSIMKVLEENPTRLVLGVSTRQQFLKRKLKKTDLLERIKSHLDQGVELEIVYDFDRDHRRNWSIDARYIT